MKSAATTLWLPSLVSTFILLPCLLLLHFPYAHGINVNVPEDFEQCMPAIFNFSQSQGNVSIIIKEEGVRKAIVNVSLPLNATSWNWTAVNIPAGENFTILVTDRAPRRRTKLSQALFQSSVGNDSSSNDTSCLPPGGSLKKDKGKSSGDNNGIGASDGSPSKPKKVKTTMISIIAGVLGGMLLLLFSLILFMFIRRRREAKRRPQDDGNQDKIIAHKIGEMRQPLHGQRVVTLYSEDGRPEGQAILGREGDAGWSYMARIVPGLTSDGQEEYSVPPQNRSGGRRGKGQKTKRYDGESKDGDLPSYRVSEYEKKALPRYAEDRRYNNGGGQHPNGAMVLTTLRDSQGSRLTFQPDPTDFNGGIMTTPRQSTRSERIQIDAEEDDEVIVFRPASMQSGELPYDRGEEHDETIQSFNQADTSHYQANTSAIETHPQSNSAAAYHRRSQSEASLRHMPPQMSTYNR